MEGVQFKRVLGFWSATMMGVGALIGAGIFILSGSVVNMMGVDAFYVYLFALIAAFLTALSYAELATTYVKSGGSYTYVKEIMGGWSAFLTGWAIISGSIVACSLYALGFGAYFLEFFHDGTNVISSSYIPIVAIAISLFFLLLNIRGAEKAGYIENIITGAKIIILIIIVAFALKLVQGSNFVPGVG